MLIFFCENQHEASFYIKEQMQKYKFEIWVLKTTILDPQKARFFSRVGHSVIFRLVRSVLFRS